MRANLQLVGPLFFLLNVFLPPLTSQVNRSYDGMLNNPLEIWGSAFSNVINKAPLAYSDGISAPAGPDRPNPREVSNLIFPQDLSIDDPLGLSAYVWVWGQFIDHDITLSPDNPEESMNIPVPLADPHFDPHGTGQRIIPMKRSAYDKRTGTSVQNPRVHFNGITAFIDGSAVYGSDEVRASWLRTFSGGKLKTSEGNLLPFNTVTGEAGDAIDPDAPEMAMPFAHVQEYFVAGDVRANENPFLTSIHTVFVREHNRICNKLKIKHPNWDDEQLYQKARKIVGGQIQAIVYEEWLFALGVHLEPYSGYDKLVNPGIMNEFSTAAYRYGHSTITPILPRMDNAGNTIPQGDIRLRDAFFNPKAIQDIGGIEPYLIGGASMMEQDLDCKVIDELRNFLFGPPGAGGLDLVALNINRGRDRGLSDYNTIRESFGLPRLASFDQMSNDTAMNQLLAYLYEDINNVDPWVGMLAEVHMPNALFGPTAMRIISQQFTAIRNGDRFYYEADPNLTAAEKREIKGTRLSDVIKRNTGVTLIHDQVFQTMLDIPVVNRTIDGTMNNPDHNDWGATNTKISVASPYEYEDGISSPSGQDRPNPRLISNEIFAQEFPENDPLELSAYVWAWGQFIDHDITLSPDHPEERMDIPIPRFDAYFDPAGTGKVIMPMKRSDYDPTTGTGPDNPRVHINGISAYIDASAVYGSDLMRAAWLRTFSGGKLKTSQGNLLPYNTVTGEAYDPIDPDAPEMAMPFPFIDRYYIAGDVRANENPFLTSLHTIFVREHNRLTDQLVVEHPDWTDEELYQRARKIVGALIQAVVYEEWLPTLGMQVTDYNGYDQTVDPTIMNVFSTAAYRYGHSTITPILVTMDNAGNYMGEGMPLKDAFFNPGAIPSIGGIEPFLTGMSTVVQQDFDTKVIDDLRNFLFGPPGSGGLDLVALNINRGRDRGLADYNSVRGHFGLNPVPSFATISKNPLLNQELATVYTDIDNVDPWVGMLAEDHMKGALFGETAMTIIKKQFMDIRDGDRFYYAWDPEFTSEEVAEIKETLLSDIIRRNTGITFIQDSVFVVRQLTTSVAENQLQPLDFQVYPNPVRDQIEIQIDPADFDGRECMVDLIDSYGRVLISKKLDQISFGDRTALQLERQIPSGIYYVRVHDQEKLGTKAVVKID